MRVDAADNLNQGRDAFLRQRWTDAYGLLMRANRHEPLEPTDLERLAMAAYLLGKDAESAEIWTRAHQEYLGSGAVARAARCAFWLASGLMHQGERARAGGWITRARELQVLQLVARGKTNREIASALFISDRTVERHVSNIFNKLDLPSRSAATAYAYEHQLL
jgi:DNA-binding NarL/FixJ family response regulator